MDVEYPVGEARHETPVEERHVAREHLELDAVDAVEQRLEVRALAGGEDADPHHAAAPSRSLGYAPPVETRRPSSSSSSTRASTWSARRWANVPYAGSPS